jgi:hypothetical protein
MPVLRQDFIGKIDKQARETLHSGTLYLPFVLCQPPSSDLPSWPRWGDAKGNVGHYIYFERLSARGMHVIIKMTNGNTIGEMLAGRLNQMPIARTRQGQFGDRKIRAEESQLER